MDSLLSAIASDLLGRALSMVIQRYWRFKGAEEEKLQRLQAVLLRIDATVEEAEARHVTNQAMLRQLQVLREGMYRGCYTLDTFRYRAHSEKADDEVNATASHSLASSRFSSSGRLSFSVCKCNGRNMDKIPDAVSSKNLDVMLGSLERLIDDAREFVVFLGSYPRICRRQPHSAHLVLGKVMFGRQMEKDMIISFLLRREAVSNGNLGVLPIIGPVRVGKSTLVEHVCLDDRVRDRFSMIVFFTGDDLDGGNLATLTGTGVIKHQNLTHTSCSESLVVIELAGDMDEETWTRLHTSAANHMAAGSKIILTSSSQNIASFGTTPPLTLKFLHRVAYWYFFKAIAFGGTDPGDRPELAALGMEIAGQLHESFLAANVVGSLLRDNPDARFWRRVLRCERDCTEKNILMFGEHQMALLQKGRPSYSWTVARTRAAIVIRSVYQECSSSPRRLGGGVPSTTTQGVMSGSVLIPRGEFEAVAWKSTIPPYHTYLASCVCEKSKRTEAGQKRSRQHRA